MCPRQRQDRCPRLLPLGQCSSTTERHSSLSEEQMTALPAFPEEEEGGPAQEETLGGVEATQVGSTTCFHHRSCPGAFHQQRSQLGSSVPDPQGDPTSPLLSGLQRPHLEKRMGVALHTPLALHPTTPRAAAPRVP